MFKVVLTCKMGWFGSRILPSDPFFNLCFSKRRVAMSNFDESSQMACVSDLILPSLVGSTLLLMARRSRDEVKITLPSGNTLSYGVQHDALGEFINFCKEGKMIKIRNLPNVGTSDEVSV